MGCLRLFLGQPFFVGGEMAQGLETEWGAQ